MLTEVLDAAVGNDLNPDTRLKELQTLRTAMHPIAPPTVGFLFAPNSQYLSHMYLVADLIDRAVQGTAFPAKMTMVGLLADVVEDVQRVFPDPHLQTQRSHL